MMLKNNFLLAMPEIDAAYFAGTLTYICEHNENGAMGIVVNRESDMSLLELLAQLGLQTDRKWIDTPVFDGGPVSTERGTVLHSDDVVFESSATIGHGLCVSTAMEALDAVAKNRGPKQFLVCLGYVGWDAGQLEDEIAKNIWLTAPASKEIIFHTHSKDKLQLAAEVLGVDIHLVATRAGYA